jgi:hypothetical protein
MEDHVRIRFIRASLLTLFAVFLAAAPARAAAVTIGDTTIGAFSWDFDPVFGPIFTVENFFDSGVDFTDVLIHATLDDSSILSLALGIVPQGEIRQTFEDLTPFTIDFATLTFNAAFLGTDPIPGVFNVAALTFAGTSQPINFSPTPVPEPSTLLLVGGGCAVALWRRRRRSAARHS